MDVRWGRAGLRWDVDADVWGGPLSADQRAATAEPGAPADAVLSGLYLWDPWPVLDENGAVADIGGQEWWMALAAGRGSHPEQRHDHARLRLVRRSANGWSDRGHVFPDGDSPGSREWSGTAMFDSGTSQLSVLYTATGVRGERSTTFRQRIFQAHATVVDGALQGWSAHEEVLKQVDPYLPAREEHGPSTIRAFRDPYIFRDLRDGQDYLLFAGSVADEGGHHAGAVGVATMHDGQWAAAAPLITAEGFNRELERPHMVTLSGRYYLFCSSHGHSFRPGIAGRTGLYGFSADHVLGPYAPMNVTGLVLANPDEAPYACYAWQVLHDGKVVSFLNYPSAAPGPLADDASFAGSIAAFLHLDVDRGVSRVRGASVNAVA